MLAGFVVDDTKNFFDNPKNRFDYFKMLTKFFENAPKEFFAGKAETFLTCLSLSTFLKETFIDKELGSLFEEFSLHSIRRSFVAGFVMSDVQLLIKELPKILKLPYPVVNEIRAMCLVLIPKITEILRHQITGPEYMNIMVDVHEFKYIMKMLNVFDSYNHK